LLRHCRYAAAFSSLFKEIISPFRHIQLQYPTLQSLSKPGQAQMGKVVHGTTSKAVGLGSRPGTSTTPFSGYTGKPWWTWGESNPRPNNRRNGTIWNILKEPRTHRFFNQYQHFAAGSYMAVGRYGCVTRAMSDPHCFGP